MVGGLAANSAEQVSWQTEIARSERHGVGGRTAEAGGTDGVLTQAHVQARQPKVLDERQASDNFHGLVV